VAGQEIERKLSGPSEALQPIAASLLSLWSYFIFTKFSHQQQYHLVFSLTFATCRTHEPDSEHLFPPIAQCNGQFALFCTTKRKMPICVLSFSVEDPTSEMAAAVRHASPASQKPGRHTIGSS